MSLARIEFQTYRRLHTKYYSLVGEFYFDNLQTPCFILEHVTLAWQTKADQYLSP